MSKLPQAVQHRILALSRSFVVLALSVVSGCTELVSFIPSPNILQPLIEKPSMSIFPVGYTKVPGWKGDNLSEALPALLRSCEKLKKRPNEKTMGIFDEMGKTSDWLPICKAAQLIRPGNETDARYFFETRFQAYTVANNQKKKGLITGYYEAKLNGAFGADSRYRYPILARPNDIVNVDLTMFEKKFEGSKITGRIVGSKLVPYYTRSEIEDGALSGRKLETLWVDNAIDAFILHIQGSGRVILPNNSYVRVGFDGRNGHKYTSIGRELVATGALSLKDVTMPAIRTWMEENPVAAGALMRKNKSFIFFKISKEKGPIGAQGVVLTATRSIAVDRTFYPMGIPIWLDTTVPGTVKKMRRLVITQDTGSAIKGPVRGDFFWGNGQQAAINAGIMKQQGEIYLLLPKTAARGLLTK